MDAWIITLVNDELEIVEDEITYDETAVMRIAEEMGSIAKGTEVVAIGHVVLDIPWS